ncbi:MAG: hypothetical protein DMG97_30405 [Acidobacteria bacterium]|nr:MAG: hypothetical protein DMG97_30405 [Acidobacteriota bacterium]
MVPALFALVISRKEHQGTEAPGHASMSNRDFATVRNAPRTALRLHQSFFLLFKGGEQAT